MSDSPVTIATYSSAQHAHLAKGALGAHDIPAAVLDEHVANLIGSTGYFDGIRLQVRACDVQEALEILDLSDEDELLEGAPEDYAGPAEADIQPAEGQLCPLCGNHKPGWTQRLRDLIGAVLATSTSAHQQACSACGTVREY